MSAVGTEIGGTMEIVGHYIEKTDLIKARPHKYVKRTGSPGNYRYWYKMPDGSIRAEDDMQEAGKLEHVRRLIAGRMHGHVSHDNNEIARITGAAKRQVQLAHSNIQREQRRQQARGNVGHHGHDFENHHLQEAMHTDVAEHNERYHAHVREHEGSARAVSKRTVARRSRRSAPATEAATPAPAAPATPAPATPAASSGDAFKREADRLMGVESDAAHNMGFRHDRRREMHMKRNVTSGTHTITRTAPSQWMLHAHHDEHGTRASSHSTLAGALRASQEREEADRRPRTLESAMPSRREAATRPASSSTPARGEGAAAAPSGLDDILRKLKTEHGLDLATPAAPAAEAAPAEPRRPRAPASPARVVEPPARVDNPPTSAEQDQQVQGTERSPEERAQVEARQARARAQAASARAQVRNQAIHPDGAAARQLHEADPEFARADEPVRAMLDAESSGENPYLHRAKGIYERIKSDLKPERKAVVDHVLQSIEQLKAAGQPLNEANLVNKYKELSGKRIRGISGIADDFEKGTFISLEEIISNRPIDIEVERMKRGFAAKQFARMQPYLSESFKSQHPGAPPPYPTYNDLKGWAEHGSSRPAEMSWTTPTGRAGGVTKAMPIEFYNSIAKGPDGKPQMPPGDLPLHLVPAWNYVVKKAAAEGSNPYATGNFGSPVGQDQKINAGNQAKFQEGIYRSALRKYVQMRGEHNLVDIPHSKLSEMGMTHADIFKALKNGDIRRKIIDPVALIPFIDAEFARGVKKSWSLVVGEDQPIFKSVTKAQLIAKIKRLKKGLE